MLPRARVVGNRSPRVSALLPALLVSQPPPPRAPPQFGGLFCFRHSVPVSHHAPKGAGRAAPLSRGARGRNSLPRKPHSLVLAKKRFLIDSREMLEEEAKTKQELADTLGRKLASSPGPKKSGVA
eukprot:g21970.t1